MTPTPEMLETCAFLMRNPEIPWQCCQHGEWEDSHFASPWNALWIGGEIRIHPDHAPKPEPRWTINKTVPTLLEYKDADGATKFGAIQKQDDEHVWFFNFAKAYILDKATGEVTALDPEP